MKKQMAILFMGVLTMLGIGSAMADPVDNPGLFIMPLDGSAPYSFITFKTGATGEAQLGSSWVALNVSNGATGEVNSGVNSMIEGDVRIGGTVASYGGQDVHVEFIDEGVSGFVDASEIAFEIDFEGRLKFTLSSAVTGFYICETSSFSVPTGYYNYNPGTHTVSEVDLEGYATVPPVQITPFCDASAASFINTYIIGTGAGPAYFWWIKLRPDPDFEGSL